MVTARKTLTFTDSDGVQHAIPGFRILDIRLKDNVATVVLGSNETYTVASPPYADLLLTYNGLIDNLQAYM